MPAGLKMLGLLGLLTGGTTLGLVLASFADPIPREASGGDPLERAARPDFTPGPSYVFIETGPEDLSPPALPDGYTPHWVDEGEHLWQYPEPEMAAWEPVPFPTLAEIEAKLDSRLRHEPEFVMAGERHEAEFAMAGERSGRPETRLNEDAAPLAAAADGGGARTRSEAAATAPARSPAARPGEDSYLAALY